MNITTAKQISIIDYLKQKGISHTKKQGVNYWYLSPIRTEDKPSFKVNASSNEWYDFGIGKGGDIIDLAKELYNVQTTSEALRYLSGQTRTLVSSMLCSKNRPQRRQTSNEMRDIQYVPLSHPALISYMFKRHIDLNIGRVYCCEIHYKIRNANYFGIAFRNRQGGFEIRNPYFKGCVGHKDITIQNSNKEQNACHCCLFEGFMDFLSYVTLLDKQDTEICISNVCDYIVLNSVSNINKVLDLLDSYQYIHSYLDNDDAGKRTLNVIQDKYKISVIDESCRYKDFNDLNDYLVKHKNM